MAKIIKKKSDLVVKRNRTVATNVIGHALLLVCGVLFIELAFAFSPLPLIVLMGIASVVGLLMVHTTWDKMGIEDKGVEGEEIAMKMLEKALPNTFYCINNAIIHCETGHNELDIIVVGPTGIYIVEVKNTVGRISGSYSDIILSQIKKRETKEMRNPVQQVRKHADTLQRFLKANGIRSWVQGVVFFVNSRCNPEITDIPENAVPIFAVSSNGEHALAHYLKTNTPNSLTQQEIEKITSLI